MKINLDGLTLTIFGFTNVRIADPDVTLAKLRREFAESEVQIMRADAVAGPEHIAFAAQNAVRAVRTGHGRSNSLAMETLLYVSGQRQISKAVDGLGITRQTKDVVVAIFSKVSLNETDAKVLADSIIHGKQDDTIIEISSEEKLRDLCKLYGISSEEIAAACLPSEEAKSVVKRLIVERSALLSTGS